MSVLVLVITFLLFKQYAYATPYYVRPNPPQFTEQPQSMTGSPQSMTGASAILSCAVNIQNIISGYNTIEMYWEFDGKKVENPEMLGDVTILHVEHGRLQLKFQHFNETNTGRYRCVMQDGLFSIVSEVAELTLYEFSGFIESSASIITTYHGDNIYIDCRANTNLPVQGVVWFKNDEYLKTDSNRRYIAMPDGVLVIVNATDPDAGNYSCRLDVVGKFYERSIEVEIKSLTADSQLKFLHKPQNKSVSLNDDNVYLLCVATGGVSLYSWLKDGISIHDSRVDYQLAAGGSILNFSNVTTDIQGVYTCVVESKTNQTINGSASLYLLIPPVVDDSVSIKDVLIEVKPNSLLVTLICPIKKSSPSPDIVWLHNTVPINLEEVNDTLSFSTEQISTTTGYNYNLRIASNSGTYQFIYDNVIGMYQCTANNEAGHTIINQRVLFKYKPNPVDKPVLHDPVCDNGCKFLVTWNETDYFYSSQSHVNYVVYMSVDDGNYTRAAGCINVHSTECTIEYSITEIRFGMYAAAVQTVFSYDYLVSDRISILSNSSNVVQLNHRSYPKNAIRPCEVSCKSYTHNDDIHMNVSWKLCPYELFVGYVDNYFVILNCSDDDADNISSFTTPSPAILNHAFENVPCFRRCNVLVKKLSSNSNSNSIVTECGITPKQSPRHPVYNVTVARHNDDGITFRITFDLPPQHEICSFEHVSRFVIKWKGPDDSDMGSDNNKHVYDSSTNNITISYEGRGNVVLKVNDSYRWKALYVSVSFNNSQGPSPWSKWSGIRDATNGDIKKEDLTFEVTGFNSSSITVQWTLRGPAESMKQAQFITMFVYFLNGINHASSVEGTHTFFDLKPNTDYNITSRVVTTDNNNPPSYLERYVSHTTSTEPPTDPTTTAASVSSSDGLSDQVIIVITVCAAVVILALLCFLIFRKKSETCTNGKFHLKSKEAVVSHHLLQQEDKSPETSTTSQSTQSEIGVPTTPKKELVKQWLEKNPSHRNNPAGSDGQPVHYSEENVQSEGGQDNDINYMLSRINKNPQFVLEPPPTRKSKSIKTIKAEVHRSLDKTKVEMNSSTYFSDKEGDYAKIASDAPGASTSGGGKQFVQMDNFDDPKALPPFDKMTPFCSASPKSVPTGYGEGVPVQSKDSIDHSSDTMPYLEDASSNDSPPYLENEDVELLPENREYKYNSIVNTGKKAPTSLPSILLSSHASESSLASFQGEGYVAEDDPVLLGSGAATNGGTFLQPNSNYTNPNAINELATSLDESISTSIDGQYISQAAMEDIIRCESAQPQVVKNSSKGTSSVDSDCIDCRDNPKVDV